MISNLIASQAIREIEIFEKLFTEVDDNLKCTRKTFFIFGLHGIFAKFQKRNLPIKIEFSAKCAGEFLFGYLLYNKQTKLRCRSSMKVFCGKGFGQYAIFSNFSAIYSTGGGRHV